MPFAITHFHKQNAVLLLLMFIHCLQWLCRHHVFIIRQVWPHITSLSGCFVFLSSSGLCFFYIEILCEIFMWNQNIKLCEMNAVSCFFAGGVCSGVFFMLHKSQLCCFCSFTHNRSFRFECKDVNASSFLSLRGEINHILFFLCQNFFLVYRNNKLHSQIST